MARLGVLEMLAEQRVQPVAQTQQLDRVKGALGLALLHLDSTRAALGESIPDEIHKFRARN
jgi:hypothetical protein